MKRWPTWVGRALVLCVREHDLEVLPDGLADLLRRPDLGLLAEAARQHHVEPCVVRSLQALGTELTALAPLRQAAAAARLHQLRARADLLRVGAVLDEMAVPWLVVKGPYLSEVVYRERGLRHYLDLDLLVPRTHFGEVVQELVDRGYALPAKDWTLASEQLAGELELTSPFGTPIDLHWEMLYHDSLRSRFSLSTEGIFARARRVSIEGSAVPVPDAEDTLAHLCVHAFREGGLRLQWLKDIEQAVLHQPPDWDALIRRARERRIGMVVGTLLQRSRRVLGTPVPDWVLAELVTAPWSWVTAAADHLAPAQRSIGHRSVAGLVTQATRANPAASLWTLAHLSAHRTGQLTGRRPSAPAPTVARGEVQLLLSRVASEEPLEAR